MKRVIVGFAVAVLASSSASGVAGPSTAVARAFPTPAPVPIVQWCPGQYVSKFIKDMQWDWSVCHDWHLVDNSEPDQYGVTHYHAEEGPEPPPPPGLNFCPIPPWCP